MMTTYSSVQRRARAKRILVFVAAVLVALLLLAGLGFAALFLVQESGADAGQAVQIEIPEGSSTAQIGERLAKAGVIGNSNMFRLQARLAGADASLKAGVYELTTGSSYSDVISALSKGPDNEFFVVTIPEGFVVEQIAARLEEQANIPSQEFLVLAKTGAAQFAPDHPYLSQAYSGSLEGYLFPKTYRFKAGTTASAAIEAMLDQFDVEFEQVDMTIPEARGMSVHEVVVLASMIEREAKVATERDLVSSVIYNRLGKGMRLEIDATIEYVLPGNRFRLRNSDLAVDSPYNTYRNQGLPPGAISNPGLASLMAAATPAQTDYLYYVLTSEDGSHTFCRTLDEFLVAKAKSKEVFGK